MRELVLDTETTGFEWQNGDRVTEIACIEILDKEPTGRCFHKYVFPERLVSEENTSITGLTNEFLSKQVRFIEIIDEFLDFIKNDPLVAHNAKFDMGFINFELQKAFYPTLKNPVIDTLEMARRKFSSNNSLNALCKRYKISLASRVTHGALVDAKLLAKVYGFLCFEDDNFGFLDEITSEPRHETVFINRNAVELTDKEQRLHEDFIKKIKGVIF